MNEVKSSIQQFRNNYHPDEHSTAPDTFSCPTCIIGHISTCPVHRHEWQPSPQEQEDFRQYCLKTGIIKEQDNG